MVDWLRRRSRSNWQRENGCHLSKDSAASIDLRNWIVRVERVDATIRSTSHLWRDNDPQAEPRWLPEWHVQRWKDENGDEWLLFGNPFPRMRCLARFESWEDQNQWQAVESPASLRDIKTQNEVIPHSGSIAWSGYRKKWIAIFMQKDGQASALGELWYAESNTPFGPWSEAVQILSHDRYTFYNPRVLAELTSSNSPYVLFEGTYTQQFSATTRRRLVMTTTRYSIGLIFKSRSGIRQNFDASLNVFESLRGFRTVNRL